MGEPAVQIGPQQQGAVRQISKQTFDRLDANISKEITAMFTTSKKDTDTHKLGVSLSLLSLLDSNSLGKKKNQTLEDYDSEARDVLGPRKSLVKQLSDELMQKPEVKKGFSDARTRGLVATFGSGYKAEIQKFANYIISDPFYAELGKMSDAGRKQRLTEELGKLTALDPELAQATATAFMAKEIAHNPGRIIQNLSPDEATKAVEGVLALIAKMPDEPGAAQALIGNADKAGKVLDTGSKVQTMLADTKTRRLVAAALGRAMTHRSYYSKLGDEQEATRLIQKLDADGHGDAARFVRRLRAGSAVGRGIASFTSLVALAGIVASFPPVDAQGNVQWAQIGAMTSGGLSMAGNIPTIGQFLGTDMTPLIARWIGTEFKLSKAAVAGGGKIAKLTSASKFVRVCDWLGPIGDAISVPLGVITVIEETKNEDVVGTVTNVIGTGAGILGLTGGICLLFGSTGVGLPLAAVAAVVGIGAAAVDFFFGESAMTGQVRQDLRYLGVSGAEEATYNSVATRQVTRWAANRGGAYQYTAREGRPHDEVRERAKGLDKYQKVQLINQYLKGNTSGSEERLVFEIFADTPYKDGDYLHLIEAVDTKRLANEIEQNGQARLLLDWTAKSYHYAKKPPGPAFDEFIKQLAYEHRAGAITPFADEIKPEIFHTIDPQTIVDCAKRFMDGATGNPEETAIYTLLHKTNYPQFNKAMEAGGISFVRRLRSELETAQWKNVRGWMMDTSAGKANHRVRHLAVQAGR